MENVDDHVAVIGDDPLTERVAVHTEWTELVVFFEAVFDFTGDGLELRLGRARANDKEIGEG